MRRLTLVLSFCLPALASCGPASREPAAGATLPSASSGRYRLASGPGFAVANAYYPESLYAMRMHGATGSVPVRGVFVADSALLSGRSDSSAFAVIFDSTGTVLGLMRFKPDAPHIDTLPLPPGYSPILSSIAVSPDSRLVGYVEVDTGLAVFGVIRRLADQTLVYRTPVLFTVEGTDAQLGVASWSDSTHFYFGVMTAYASDRFVRIRGQIGARSVAQDTVDAQGHVVHEVPPPPEQAPAPSN